MFCSKCGNEVLDEAVICPKCGCMLKDEKMTVSTDNKQKVSKAPVIFGILGIVFAWLFALVGHVLSIIGIVLGIKEYSKNKVMTGLILSIVGEVCAIFSSIVGAVVMGGMF